MKLIEIFVEYKRSTLTFLLILLFYGLFATKHIAKESNPDIKIPYIYVVTVMPGISPEDAQRMLVQPLENKLGSKETELEKVVSKAVSKTLTQDFGENKSDSNSLTFEIKRQLKKLLEGL